MIRKLKVTVNGTAYDVVVEDQDTNLDTQFQGNSTPVIRSISESKPVEKKEIQSNDAAGSETIEAPMPGVIVSINVSKGQNVKKGDVLLVFEAMKMENEVMCPRDGTIASINVNKGDQVESGSILMTLV